MRRRLAPPQRVGAPPQQEILDPPLHMKLKNSHGDDSDHKSKWITNLIRYFVSSICTTACNMINQVVSLH